MGGDGIVMSVVLSFGAPSTTANTRGHRTRTRTLTTKRVYFQSVEKKRRKKTRENIRAAHEYSDSETRIKTKIAEGSSTLYTSFTAVVILPKMAAVHCTLHSSSYHSQNGSSTLYTYFTAVVIIPKMAAVHCTLTSQQ